MKEYYCVVLNPGEISEAFCWHRLKKLCGEMEVSMVFTEKAKADFLRDQMQEHAPHMVYKTMKLKLEEV